MTILDSLVDVRPLRTSPAFRRLWLGTGLAAVGGRMTYVAVLYQVWELTNSPVWVGAIGLAQAVPMVVFGLVGGVMADSLDRRHLVLVAITGQATAVVLLAAQAIAGLGSVWVVLALVAARSVFASLGAPARRTFVARLLPDEQVGPGVALTHLSLQAATLVGPAIGGLIIGPWGVEACYALNVLTVGAAMYAVMRLPNMRPLDAVRVHPRAILDGWSFITRSRLLSGAFLTDLFATVMAMPIALFPAINDERFGGDPQTLGMFLSAVAAGGVAAGILSGRAARARRPGVVMLSAASAWGIGIVGFGFAHSLWLLGWLAVAGAGDTLSVIARGSIVQLATPDARRGRVSAVEHIVGAAGPDVGNMRAGVVADVTSASFAIVAGGAVCLLGIAAVAATNAPLRQFVARRDDRDGTQAAALRQVSSGCERGDSNPQGCEPTGT